MTISIYDMDRTITRGGSWVPWLLFWVRREAPWRVVMLPLLGLAMAGYALKLLDRGALKALGHRLLMGRRLARARVAAAAAVYADQVMANGVFPGCAGGDRCGSGGGGHAGAGDGIERLLCRCLAHRLGFDVVIATPSVWDGDLLSWRLGGANCYGNAKDARVADWLARGRRRGRSPSRRTMNRTCRCSNARWPAAARCGSANPSPRLRAIAVQRGWPVVDWGVKHQSLWERA